MTGLEERVRGLGARELEPVAEQAAGQAGRLLGWECQRLHFSKGGLGASEIYRFSGTLGGAEGPRPWSAVLRVLAANLGAREFQARAILEPRREYDFYASGLAGGFPAGLRAPRCYAQAPQVGEDGTQEYWLWLEDLAPWQVTEWSLAAYRRVAYVLGEMQGAFALRPALPSANWMETALIRKYLGVTEPSFQQLFALRGQPLVQRGGFSTAVVDSLAELWARREQHLALLERLPQTFCQGDANPTNLFLSPGPPGQASVAAIDWASCGIGPLGQDLAQLFLTALNRFDPAYTRALDQTLSAGYLAGLRAAGWPGDARLARLGYTAAMLKNRASYVLWWLPRLIDPASQERAARLFAARGLSYEAGLDQVAWIHAYLGELFAESLALRVELKV